MPSYIHQQLSYGKVDSIPCFQFLLSTPAPDSWYFIQQMSSPAPTTLRSISAAMFIFHQPRRTCKHSDTLFWDPEKPRWKVPWAAQCISRVWFYFCAITVLGNGLTAQPRYGLCCTHANISFLNHNFQLCWRSSIIFVKTGIMSEKAWRWKRQSPCLGFHGHQAVLTSILDGTIWQCQWLSLDWNVLVLVWHT